MREEVKDETVRRALEAIRAICRKDPDEELQHEPAKPTRPEPEFDPLDDLRAPFVEWFDSRVWLDAEAVALRRPNPRWSSGVVCLHADFCRWMIARDQVPPVLAEFLRLLKEFCFEIQTVQGEPMVANIALKEDMEAERNFDDSCP
jgi:hypothetical protein